MKLRRHDIFSPFLVLLLSFSILPSTAEAQQDLLYIWAGTASGTLAGASFADEPFVIEVQANTGSIVPVTNPGIDPGEQIEVAPGGVGFMVGGTLATSAQTLWLGKSDPANIVGLTTVNINDPTYAPPTDLILATQLPTPYGPLADTYPAENVTLFGSYLTNWLQIATSAGGLTVTDYTQITFEVIAVPTPTPTPTPGPSPTATRQPGPLPPGVPSTSLPILAGIAFLLAGLGVWALRSRRAPI